MVLKVLNAPQNQGVITNVGMLPKQPSLKVQQSVTQPKLAVTNKPANQQQALKVQPLPLNRR